MKRMIYSIIQKVQRVVLQRNGWVLSDNVLVSIHGVKKIGGGKYIVQIM